MSQNQQLENIGEHKWGYLVVKAKEGHYEVREQYSNFGLGLTARTPYGDSVEQLKWALQKMLEACDRPFIDESLSIEFPSSIDFDEISFIQDAIIDVEEKIGMVEAASCTSCDSDDIACRDNGLSVIDKYQELAELKDERAELIQVLEEIKATKQGQN